MRAREGPSTEVSSKIEADAVDAAPASMSSRERLVKEICRVAQADGSVDGWLAYLDGILAHF